MRRPVGSTNTPTTSSSAGRSRSDPDQPTSSLTPPPRGSRRSPSPRRPAVADSSDCSIASRRCSIASESARRGSRSRRRCRQLRVPGMRLDQLAGAVDDRVVPPPRRAGEAPPRPRPLDRVGQRDPRMAARLVDRDRRRRERRVGEGAERDGDQVRCVPDRVEDRPAALRTEAEPPLRAALVGKPDALGAAAGDAHPVAGNRAWAAKALPSGADTPGSGRLNPDRIALRLQAKLPTATRGVSSPSPCILGAAVRSFTSV